MDRRSDLRPICGANAPPPSGEFGAFPTDEAGGASSGGFGGFDTAPPPIGGDVCGGAPPAADGFGAFGEPAAASGAAVESTAAADGFGSGADDGFGSFGSVSAPPAPTATAPTPPALSADAFASGEVASSAAVPGGDFGAFGGFDGGSAGDGGGFGQMPSAAAAAPPAEGFGDVGGFDSTPATAVTRVDDGFGDFGGFDATPIAEPQAAATAQPPGAPLDAGMFGAAPPASEPSASDGFTGEFTGESPLAGGDGRLSGSFGGGTAPSGSADPYGFDAMPVPAPPAAGGAATADDIAAATTADDFGGFGTAEAPSAAADGALSADFDASPSDAFGGFGETVAAAGDAAAASAVGASDGFGAFDAEDDDFGDFGSFDEQSAEPASLANLQQLAADEDDSFGAFGVPLAPPSSSTVAAASAAAAGAPAGAEGSSSSNDGLASVLEQLLASERFEEAMECKKHIEALAQLAVEKANYERAKAEDDLESAIHIKKTVLPQLRQQAADEDTIANWQQPGPLTLAEMHATAVERYGADEVAPFIASCPSDLSHLAATDLVAAASRQRRARAAYELLMELPTERQKAHLEQMEAMLKPLLAQMRKALASLQKTPAHLDEAARLELMRTPKVKELLAALLELRKLGALLASSRRHHASVFVRSASVGLEGGLEGDQAVAEELEGLFARIAGLAGTDDEIEPLAPARYWQSPKPAGERCALSLLPLQCDEFAELPPTVEWGAKRFHAPCINFWVHNVKPDPPDA